jgi:hypothetical protein
MFLIFFFYLKTFQNATFICVYLEKSIFIYIYLLKYHLLKYHLLYVILNYINVNAVVCFIFIINI